MEVEKERNRKGRKSNILHCYFSLFSLFFLQGNGEVRKNGYEEGKGNGSRKQEGK